MRRSLLGVLVIASMFSISSLAIADQIPIFSTGVVSSGVPAAAGSADTHWFVGSNPAVVLTLGKGFPAGWAPNDNNSQWIGKADVQSPGPAPYTFSETFDLTGFVLSTVNISGFWQIDDTGGLFLNGTQIGSTQSETWPSGSQVAFSIGPNSGLFLSGLNTLSVTMSSSDNSFEGVRVLVSGTGNPSAVPEPGSLMLLGSGLLGTLGCKRRF